MVQVEKMTTVMKMLKADDISQQCFAVKGFTLIELMVALTIASVMMAFAIPAFNDFTEQRRMAANVK